MTRRHAALLGLTALAGAVRLLVAWRTLVPARDGATYLWIAERVVAGDWSAAWITPFHPVYPLLTAASLPMVGPVLGTVGTAQAVAGAAGALATLPLYVLGRSLHSARAGLFAAAFYAVGVWFARHPADCMSEGVFYLLVALAACALVARRSGAAACAAGVCSGLAYGVRPEGAALLLVGIPWLWCRGDRRRAALFALGGAVAALPWPLGWALWGPGITVTPKLAFNLAVGMGAAPEGGLAHYFAHLVQLPGELCETIGYGIAPLAAYGVWCLRPRLRDPATLLLGVFALQVLAIPALRSHFRFLSGYGVLLLAFAGVALARLWPALLHRGRLVTAAALLLLIATDLARLPLARRADRMVERDLGGWLRPRVTPARRVASDMPRLEYFAGQRPGPPRRIRRDEILAWCAAPDTAYAAVVEGRSGIYRRDLEALGWTSTELPQALANAAAQRGILIYER